MLQLMFCLLGFFCLLGVRLDKASGGRCVRDKEHVHDDCLHRGKTEAGRALRPVLVRPIALGAVGVLLRFVLGHRARCRPPKQAEAPDYRMVFIRRVPLSNRARDCTKSALPKLLAVFTSRTACSKKEHCTPKIRSVAHCRYSSSIAGSGTRRRI